MTSFKELSFRLKHLLLLFMVVVISFSPMVCMVFEMYDAHVDVYEIVDEDDARETIVCPTKEESEHKATFSFQKQLSPKPGILSTDFKPEVPFPPPKFCHSPYNQT
jgi:hypothetical protein